MAKRRRDDDDDFEVVDEQPRKKRPRTDDEEETRPARSARTRREEAYDDKPPRKSKRRAVVDDEDDERPRSKSRSRRDDDDRPLKKKPRLTKKDRERLRREDEDARDAARDNAIMEWGAPIFMTFLGAVMMIVSGVVLARRSDGLINPALMIGITTVYTLIIVPVVIVSLMVIGGVCGIDYGTIKNAVRSLVAITFLVNGIYSVGNLFLLGWFLAPLVAGIVTFALFMIFFSLDPQETSTSLGILNVILWVANKFVFLMIIAALARGGNRNRDFDDDDFRPKVGNKGGKWGGDPNAMDPDDDPDFDDDRD